MPEKKYLTDDEAESLKAACETQDEQAMVRELLETGMRLGQVLKRGRVKQYL